MSTGRIRALRSGGYDDTISRFAEHAFESGAAEAAYGSVPSPIGELMAVVSRKGLMAIAFDTEPHDVVLHNVAKRVTPSIVDLPSAVSGVRRQLDAYFTGELRFFDMPLDRVLLTSFQDKVLAATSAIPSGEVRTYGQIAAAAGKPKGAQATGQALGANPIPIVIPCHRVIASDGSLRGYAGGLDKKEFLLDLERGTPKLF